MWERDRKTWEKNWRVFLFLSLALVPPSSFLLKIICYTIFQKRKVPTVPHPWDIPLTERSHLLLCQWKLIPDSTHLFGGSRYANLFTEAGLCHMTLLPARSCASPPGNRKREKANSLSLLHPQTLVLLECQVCVSPPHPKAEGSCDQPSLCREIKRHLW